MTSRSVAWGLAAWRRRADAISVGSLDRISRSAALRTAARISGASPVRTRQASSPRLRSRTQCNRFSIPQCPRAIASSCFADALSGAEAGDRTDRLGGLLALGPPHLLQQAHPLHTGPVEVPRQPRGGPNPAGLNPTVALAVDLGPVVLAGPQLLLRGGKAGPNAARMPASNVGWLSLTVRK
jgi:hypothetical protein